MAAKRHLTVLNAGPPAATSENTEGAPEETPAWHWVPLGIVATVLVSAVLARVAWVPYASRWVLALGAHPTAEAMASVQTRLAMTGALVGVLGTIAGGFIVGLLGNDRVNQRHGLLSGGGAMALVGFLSGARMGAGGAIAAALMVPIGAMAGYVGAVIGLRARGYLQRRAGA